MKLTLMALAAKNACQVAAWQWQAKQRRAARQAARDEKPGL